MKRIAVFILMLILGALSLRANWGGDAGGSVGTGGFKPFGTTQVEMQNEDLSIWLFRDRAKVEVNYVLKNTGNAVDVRGGFPCLFVGTSENNYLEIEDYQFTADGKPIAYHIEKGEIGNWRTLFDPGFVEIAGRDLPGEADDKSGKGPVDLRRLAWLVSTVHFDEGQARNIRIRYESLYQQSEGGPSNDATYDKDYFRYLLSTASAWKGPIQTGKVTIQATTVDPSSITIKPGGRFHETPAGFVWEFNNLSPTLDDNIEVCLNDEFSTKFNYAADNPDDNNNASWYSFEGNKFYFDFHRYTATASSEQAGHPAKDVGDFNPETAWVAGKNGGIDESLTVTLDQPEHVDQIGIIPGLRASKRLYFANNRIRELEVLVNGKHQITATFPDEYISSGVYSKKGYELVDLGDYPGTAKTITLRVKKVYPGSRYNDTCISEVLLRKRLIAKPEVQGAR